MDYFADMVELTKVLGQKVQISPKVPSESIKALRGSLITEEVFGPNELLDSMRKDDLVGIADGIVDSIVVILGTAVAYGIDIRPIWDEVHKSNLAKADGPIREDGKRMKPEGWIPPNIADEIDNQICYKVSSRVLVRYL